MLGKGGRMSNEEDLLDAMEDEYRNMCPDCANPATTECSVCGRLFCAECLLNGQCPNCDGRSEPIANLL